MNPISLPIFDATLFVSTVLFAFLAMLTALAVLSFSDHDRGQALMWSYLGRRLAATRMFRMLERRHIEPLEYIQGAGIANLRAQLRSCRNCSRQNMCDETLKDVGVRQPSFSFCPNSRAVDQLLHAGVVAQWSA